MILALICVFFSAILANRPPKPPRGTFPTCPNTRLPKNKVDFRSKVPAFLFCSYSSTSYNDQRSIYALRSCELGLPELPKCAAGSVRVRLDTLGHPYDIHLTKRKGNAVRVALVKKDEYRVYKWIGHPSPHCQNCQNVTWEVLSGYAQSEKQCAWLAHYKDILEHYNYDILRLKNCERYMKPKLGGETGGYTEVWANRPEDTYSMSLLEYSSCGTLKVEVFAPKLDTIHWFNLTKIGNGCDDETPTVVPTIFFKDGAKVSWNDRTDTQWGFYPKCENGTLRYDFESAYINSALEYKGCKGKAVTLTTLGKGHILYRFFTNPGCDKHSLKSSFISPMHSVLL